MAFLLLGRTEDGVWSLLSDASFPARQDAMAELSRITGRASFDRWSEDVLMLDTDTATPVLLVRPAFAPQPESDVEAFSPAETVSVVEAEDVAMVWAEPIAQQVGDPAIADMIVEEAAEEPLSLRDAIARTAVHMEAAGVVATQSVGPLERVVEPLSEPREEPAESAPEPEPASGVPPEQAADARMEPEQESVYALPSDDEGGPDSEPSPEDDNEFGMATQTRTEPDVFIGAVELSADFGQEAVSEPEGAVDTEPPLTREVAAWPWDTAPAESEPAAPLAPEIDLGYVTAPLEEPALDDGSMLRGTIEDDMFAVARPVIFGDYPEPASMPEAAREPEAVLADTEISAPSIAEPMGVSEASAGLPLADTDLTIDLSDFELVSAGEPEPASLAATESADVDIAPETAAAPEPNRAEQAADDISAFILDLESVTTVPEGDDVASVPAQESVAADGVSEYTCADCVYVETCPNKDQRLPADCGTFQWR